MNGEKKNEQPNKHKAKGKLVEQKKTAESTKHLGYETFFDRKKHILKMTLHTYPAISSQVVTRKPLGSLTHCASNILGRTGDLRGF